MRDDAPFHVGHLVRQTAGLRAVATVGAAPGVRVADVTLATVGDAQRAVNKELQRGLGPCGGTNCGNLAEIELARQHDLTQAHVLQEAGLLRGADVGLGAGVQLDRWQVEFQQTHVLDDQRIDTGVVELPDLLPRRFQFVVAQNRVERDEHARVEAVRVPHQSRNVGHLVGGRGTRAERGTADVNGVGAVVDGFDADIGVARGREQFKLMGFHRGRSGQQNAILPARDIAPGVGRGTRCQRLATCTGACALTAAITRFRETSLPAKNMNLPMLNSERLIVRLALAMQVSP